MHSLVGAGLIMASAILIVGCTDPATSPAPWPESELARRPSPVPPVGVPDSIGISPTLPPIYEEAPPGIDGPQ
jgi:hypothetical protein